MGTGTGAGTGLDDAGHVVNGNTAYGTNAAYGTNTGYANGGAPYTTDNGGPYGAPTVQRTDGHTNGHANGLAGPKPLTPSQNF